MLPAFRDNELLEQIETILYSLHIRLKQKRHVKSYRERIAAIEGRLRLFRKVVAKLQKL